MVDATKPFNQTRSLAESRSYHVSTPSIEISYNTALSNTLEFIWPAGSPGSWNLHIDTITCQASRTPGYIEGNLKSAPQHSRKLAYEA